MKGVLPLSLKKNKEIIYQYLIDKMNLIDINEYSIDERRIGIDACDIEKELKIVRNNASTLLNELCKEGLLYKIMGRPVRFIPMVYKNKFEKMNKEKQLNSSPFDRLIGAQSSLSSPIEQAKAALLYPPSGLHTLIIGESGVGKTLFAKTMHQYLEYNKNKAFPFVAFNCADYFNNPELLMSQLFGHVKGAFTGAISDKLGLVDAADGGVLFLDEIHRLPYQGQEMLFRLIDSGQYSRLGEASDDLKANVLIIAATTEEPDKCLLKTFLRRIPVTIALPCFKQLSIENRIELIEKVFNKESQIIHKGIIVKNKVIQLLALYKCAGNIGQLESDIKLVCAKAYKYNKENIDLCIELNDLPKHILDCLEEYDLIKKEYLWYIKSVGDLITGLDSPNRFNQPSINIESYYSEILATFNEKHFELKELYNLIGTHIVNAAFEAIQYAESKLSLKFKEDFVFAFSFHVKNMIQRIDRSIPSKLTSSEQERIMESICYPISLEMLKVLSSHVKKEFLKEEALYITLILEHALVNKEKDTHKINILMIQHGDSTATSMANVCNRLFHTDLVKAIDVPLDKPITEFHSTIKNLIQRLNLGGGMIILSDMGSTTSIGEQIALETNIKINTIKNTSLPIALETVRKVLYTDLSIDEITQNTVEQQAEVSVKPLAMLSICSTGEGGGKLAKMIVEQFFIDHHVEGVEVFALDIESVEKKKAEYLEIMSRYDVFVNVGSIDPQQGLPFVDIYRILKKEGQDELLDIIANKQKHRALGKRDDPYSSAEAVLINYVAYINPHFALTMIKQFIDKLKLNGIAFNDDLISKFAIHSCCMMERIIMQQRILYDEKEALIQENDALFQHLRGAIVVIEDKYRMKVSDDELCYMIKILNYR